MNFFAPFDQQENSFFNQTNKYESFFNEDNFFDDMPSLKRGQNSYFHFQEPNLFIDYNQPETPQTLDDKVSDEVYDSQNSESEYKQEPLDSCEAFNTEASTFASSPRFSGSLECNTNAPRDSEMSSFKSEADSTHDIVSEILGSPFLQSTNLLTLIERSITSDNSKLVKVLEKVFRGNKVAEDELSQMNYFERCIIAGVQNKANNGPSKKKKREEEKQKLFFKAVLKQTDKDFFKAVLESKKKIKRKQIDRLGYYFHYWGECAKEKGIDIACFFHPNKKIAKGNTSVQTIHTQNPWVKSLNTTYIELILASKSFRDVTSQYLQSNFSQDYIKSRSKKIGKMLNTMQIIAMEAVSSCADLCENQQQKFVADAIMNYINCNPKCKLPWFNFELKEAMDYAGSMIVKLELAQESSELLKKNGCNFPELF